MRGRSFAPASWPRVKTRAEQSIPVSGLADFFMPCSFARALASALFGMAGPGARGQVPGDLRGGPVVKPCPKAKNVTFQLREAARRRQKSEKAR